MMNMCRLVILILAVVSLNACMMSSGSVAVKTMSGGPTGPRVVTFLKRDAVLHRNDGSTGRKHSQSSQWHQGNTSQSAPGKIGQYNEASTRYGLTLMAAPTSYTQALTSHAVYNFT